MVDRRQMDGKVKDHHLLLSLLLLLRLRRHHLQVIVGMLDRVYWVRSREASLSRRQTL